MPALYPSEHIFLLKTVKEKWDQWLEIKDEFKNQPVELARERKKFSERMRIRVMETAVEKMGKISMVLDRIEMTRIERCFETNADQNLVFLCMKIDKVNNFSF